MHDDDLERAFGALRDHFPDAHVAEAGPNRAYPPAWRWRERWRAVPFGTCARPACPWPAHTLGPDGQPWHAYCWPIPDQPISAFELWMFHKVEAGEWNGDRRPSSAETEATLETEPTPAPAPVGTCQVCGGAVLPSSRWPDCHPACRQWPNTGRRYGP